MCLFNTVAVLPATNYDPMMRRGDIVGLDDEDRSYVEENRWPPICYMKQLEDFESCNASLLDKSSKDGCILM